MKILALNSGSSTLKFKLFEMPEEKILFSGTFERIGSKQSFYTTKINGEKIVKEKIFQNHSEAIETLLKEIIEYNVLKSLEEIKGIGMRLVGHYKDKNAVKLNNEILDEISLQIDCAPLHLPSGIDSIRGFMKLFPNTNYVGCFDSAFHNTLSEDKYLYALPYKWYKDYGVRKYGYHGLSSRYITERMQKVLNNDKCNLIICHIGQGASVCAVKDGKSFDTSMGFTTNSGVIMGTRSGDIDYGIIKHISKLTGKSFDEIDNDLYHQSGLFGLTDHLSCDWRDIDNEISKGNQKAKIAHYAFVNSILGYVSRYYMELDKVDAICFSAGIGENSPHIRRMLVERLSKIGLKIDKNMNEKVRLGEEGKISSDDSSIPIYIVPTDEEIIIARDTYEEIK